MPLNLLALYSMPFIILYSLPLNSGNVKNFVFCFTLWFSAAPRLMYTAPSLVFILQSFLTPYSLSWSKYFFFFCSGYYILLNHINNINREFSSCLFQYIWNRRGHLFWFFVVSSYLGLEYFLAGLVYNISVCLSLQQEIHWLLAEFSIEIGSVKDWCGILPNSFIFRQ